jgi:hypothetical protein
MVHQISSAPPGVGDVALPATAASGGRRTFDNAVGNGNSTKYFLEAIDNNDGSEWGYGTVTVSGTASLSRDTVKGTSNGDTVKINFTGLVNVWVGVAAEEMIFLHENQMRNIPNGSAAAPAIAFESDLDTGLFRKGANDLGVAAGGAEIADFNSAGLTLAANKALAFSGTGAATTRTNLGAVADPGGNGLMARTAAGASTPRTITGTAGQITVTNGDGVAGNPTLSLPASVTIASVMRAGVFKSVVSTSIADDGVLVVNTGQLDNGFMFLMSHQYASTPIGIYMFRNTTSPIVVNFLSISHANLAIAAAGTVLTGTTGTDGKFTLSSDASGNLYLENRTGGTRPVSLVPMGA